MKNSEKAVTTVDNGGTVVSPDYEPNGHAYYEESQYRTSAGCCHQESGFYTKRPKGCHAPGDQVIYQEGSTRDSGSQLFIDPDGLSEEAKEEYKIHTSFLYEEFRLDVDGQFPQMMASGYRRFPEVYWIASLQKTGNHSYEGRIWYKFGQVESFPYSKVFIQVYPSCHSANQKVKVSFCGPCNISKTSIYKFESPFFHRVTFEYDYEQGIFPETWYYTGDHPNRPANLPLENLSIGNVFRRAGFDAQVSYEGEDQVFSELAGADGQWSDMEMHDAMQMYWSSFANSEQWALWTFFGRQHEWGYGLGGIMFDSIGPNHRQGTALFYDSFISEEPFSDPDPQAHARRMRFWTAVHEMGHAFNLAHSWQKSLGAPYGIPWLPLQDEEEARSYMNYPYAVNGGYPAFFSTFEYRFSNTELLFLRHAPSPFVQMGNYDWFDHHGFERLQEQVNHDLSLQIQLSKQSDTIEFLEPVYIDMAITNILNSPVLIDKNTLANSENLILSIQRKGADAKLYKPFAKYLFNKESELLQPKASQQQSLFVSAGTNGWYIQEPGMYTIKAFVTIDNKVYDSNTLTFEVLRPASETESQLATEYFQDDVARVLAFRGSAILEKGNRVLEKVAKELPERAAATHACFALANPLMRNYKTLQLDVNDTKKLTTAAKAEGRFKVRKAQPKQAMNYLQQALLGKKDNGQKVEAVLDQLGVKTGIEQILQASRFLKEQGNGNQEELAQTLNNLEKALDKSTISSELKIAFAPELEKLKK